MMRDTSLTVRNAVKLGLMLSFGYVGYMETFTLHLSVR